jgi:26S proteasome non-ATPase regulatory subunit 9
MASFPITPINSDLNKAKVNKMYKQREELEAEMSSLSQRLNEEGQPGLKGALVDKEGFPIPNVDLYQIRSDRQRYNTLKNDHSRLTDLIQSGLQNILLVTKKRNDDDDDDVRTTRTRTTTENNNTAAAAVNKKSDVQQEDTPSTTITTTTVITQKAFAVVDIVAPGSPAEIDGIRIHDRIISFGDKRTIEEAAAKIQQTIGESHIVKLNRQGVEMEVEITPRTWTGVGLLGAHFRSLNF